MNTPQPRQSPPATSAADLLGPKETLEIQEAGRIAAFTGDPVITCPWATPNDAREAARRLMWIRGYAAGQTDLRIARDSGPGTPPVP